MDNFKILIVEDEEEDLKVYRQALNDFNNDDRKPQIDFNNDDRKPQIESVECMTLDEALTKLDKTFDGAIIDLRLNGEIEAGNAVGRRIESLRLRMPVVILTGTPNPATPQDYANIGVRIKGDKGASYLEILEDIYKIHKTGLTNIISGEGYIEDVMSKVYRENLLPEINKWARHSDTDQEKAKKALLRHTLDHMRHRLVSMEPEECYPEEMYLHPPVDSVIRTGLVVKRKEDNKFFIVLTPACDLVERKDGRTNTDTILLGEIELLDALKSDDKQKLPKTNHGKMCFHSLPPTDFFKGGRINFRKLLTSSIHEGNSGSTSILSSEYECHTQISPVFVKDIVSRFAAYYARQGQPEIEWPEINKVET